VADARVLKINFVDHVIVGQAMAVGLGYFSFEERVLASVYKCLRLCDLCKELAFGAPAQKGEVAIFIQLVRAQPVVPPVPGE
jgi:hypothetical protein